MSKRESPAPVRAIWLLIAFGAIQPIVWSMPGGLTRRPGVVIPMLLAWITLLVIAALATRRITALWRKLTQEELAHRAARVQLEQLQTQNAVLEAIARSVDVPFAFQELARSWSAVRAWTRSSCRPSSRTPVRWARSSSGCGN